jgi:hypothetical protein
MAGKAALEVREFHAQSCFFNAQTRKKAVFFCKVRVISPPATAHFSLILGERSFVFIDLVASVG